MAKMEIIQPQVPQQGNPLSVRYDNRELVSGVGIGEEAMQAGQHITALAQEAFNKASAANSDALYNNAITGAQTALAQAVQQRLSQTTDDKGNPTFGTLPQDIGQISQQIGAQFSSNLIDPAARQRFNMAYNTLATQHTINAMGAARKQQVDFAQGSLTTSLQSNIQQGVQSGNPDFYFNQSQDQINQAVKNGYITPQEGDLQSDRVRQGIYYGGLQTLNQTDPASAKGMLDNATNEQLNITQQERLKLEDENRRSFSAQATQQKQVQAEQANIQKQKQNIVANNTDIQITHGLLNEPAVDSLYNQGLINSNQHRALVDKIAARDGENSKQQKIRNDINQDIQSGNDLTGKYSEGQVNNYYEWQKKLAQDPTTKQPISLMQSAQLIGNIHAPVTKFTTEITSTVSSGNNQQIMQAVQAYNFAHSLNPLAVSKLDKNTLATISMINTYSQATNLDNNTIISNVKTKMAKNIENQKQLIHQYSTQEPDFQPGAIDNTLRSMYKLDDADSGFPLHMKTDESSSIDPATKSTLETLLQDAYVLTGDSASAKEMVQKETAGVVGVTHVSGQPGQRLMLAPPEQVYTNIPLSVLQKDFIDSYAGSLKKGTYANNSHIAPTDLSLESDQMTYQQIGAKDTQGNPITSYAVYYHDAYGEHPLMNPETGAFIRFRPHSINPNEANQQLYQDQRSQGGAVQLGTGRTNIPTIKGPVSQINPADVPQGLPIGARPTNNPAPYAPSYPPLNTADSTMMKLKSGVAKAEGNGSYTQLGMALPNGDRALGKYQVMASNLPAWSKEAFGRVVSREEFLNSPHLQEKLFEDQMHKLMAKYGNMKDAISVWFTGRPYAVAKAANAKDRMTGTTLDQYEANAQSGMRGSNRLASND